MRFAMIFEGVDRASRVMNKLMNGEKKLAAAAKANAAAGTRASSGSNRTTERQISLYSRLGSVARSAYSAVVSGAQAAARATAALHRATVSLGRTAFGQIQSGAGKTFRGLTVAAGLVAAAFGTSALAASQLIGTASQFQRFQTILETTEGSSAKAQSAMGWVSNFAVKTPYELDQVMESFVKLRSYGIDPTNGLLESLGDTSAAMGKPLMQSVEAVADAMTGENERLKEFGITASKTGDKITYSYTNAAGKMEKASVRASDRMAIQQKLMEVFNAKYGGAMVKLAATWDGMTSNLSDLWMKFQLGIMNAGLFDWMQGKLQFVLDTVNKMADDGTFDAWAKRISDKIIMVLETAWQFATRIYEILQRVGEYLKVAANYVGGWENLAMVLAGIAFAPTLIATAAGLVQIAMGVSMLGAALMANPIMLAIAAIAAGAVAIWYNWEPIKAFFVDLWATITAGAQAVADAIERFTGIDPMAALSAFVELNGTMASMAFDAFSDISSRLGSLWDSLPSLEWADVVTALEWASWIYPILWMEFIPNFSWRRFVRGVLDLGKYVLGFEWAQYIPPFSWAGFLTMLDWASWILPIRWLELIPGFSWEGIVSGVLDLSKYVLGFAWTNVIQPLNWSSLLTVLNWASWVLPIRWLELIPGFSWEGIINGVLDLGKYVLGFAWTNVIQPLNWSSLLTVLNWASWVLPIRWLELIPGFSWEGIVNGALDLGKYVLGFEWATFIPSFSWPELPAFSWPEIPNLELPELPKVGEWIGKFSDEAMAAIENVSAKLGTAWAKVKSAFSFGDETAAISVADPATIQAAAAATAGLKADMQAVAAINTTAAMDRLSALQRAAGDVLAAVTSSIQRAQAVAGSINLYAQGAALMDTMAAGVRARAAVLVQEIERVAQTIRDHLPSSPAKVGPLSDIHRLKFGETIAGSIRAEPMVKAMRAAALATMGAAAITTPAMAGPAVTPGDIAGSQAGTAEVARQQVARIALQSASAEQQGSAGGITLQFSPTLNLNGNETPANLKSELDAMLRDSARQLTDYVMEELRRRKRKEH